MKPLVAAAGLAVANAFVVVPDIAQIDSDIVNALPFEAPFTASHQSLELNCPACPMLRPGKAGKPGKKHRVDIPNHLDLDFTIDHEAAAGDRLLLNGFELYPNADPWNGALTAPQVADITSKHHHPNRKTGPHDVQLGYSLAVRPMPKEDAAQQLQLIDVELQVIEIGNYFVDGIPTVKVGLLKSPTGELMIARVDTAEPTAVPDKAEECDTLICRWRAMVNDQLDALKKFRQHCGGRKQGQQENSTEQGTGDYRVIYRHRTWSQLFRNVTTYILLPVLIGIFAGVSISLLGMLVGTVVVCLWRFFYRRQNPFARRHCRRRGHSCHKTNVAEIAVAPEEKSGLMDSQDAPPQYDMPEESEIENNTKA